MLSDEHQPSLSRTETCPMETVAPKSHPGRRVQDSANSKIPQYGNRSS